MGIVLQTQLMQYLLCLKQHLPAGFLFGMEQLGGLVIVCQQGAGIDNQTDPVRFVVGLIDTYPHARSNQKVAFGVAVNIEEIALDDLQLFFFSQPILDFLYLFVFDITSIPFDGVNATLNLLNLHGCYLRARWQLAQRLQLVEDSSPSAPRTCRTIQESLNAMPAISSRRAADRKSTRLNSSHVS